MKKKELLFVLIGLVFIAVIILFNVFLAKDNTLIKPPEPDEAREINADRDRKYVDYMTGHHWKLHTNWVSGRGLIYTVRYPPAWSAVKNDDVMTFLTPTTWDIHRSLPEGYIMIKVQQNPENLTPQQWHDRYNRYTCLPFTLNTFDACRVVVKGAGSDDTNVGIYFTKNGYLYSLNAIAQGEEREEIMEVFPYVLASFRL